MFSYITCNDSNPDIDGLTNSKVLAFDVETSGLSLSSSTNLGFSLAHRYDDAYYVRPDHEFAKLLTDDRIKVAHNASFDRSMMKKEGVCINNNIACTMVAANMLELKELSLSSVFDYFRAKYEDFPDFDFQKFKDLDKPIDKMSRDELALYSGPHSIAALAIWNYEQQEMKRLGIDKPFWNIEMPVLPVLSDIELNGVEVDKDLLISIGESYKEKIEILLEQLNYLSPIKGMNHNSPKQVSHLLYDVFGLPDQGLSKHTVDKRYLDTIKHLNPYIPVYLLYKQYMTLVNSYIKSLLDEIEDGRIYARFNQAATKTGRLSSSSPNLQKIPERSEEGKKIRRAFVAPEGKILIKADYNQLELRILAICSNEQGLIDAFSSGKDIHTETSLKAFGDDKHRSEAKTLNYKLVYGGGTDEQRSLLNMSYPGVPKWQKEFREELLGREGSLCVRTLGGRLQTFVGGTSIKDFSSSNKIFREAMSHRIQGSAIEEVKKAMVRCWKVIKDSDIKMVIQVHDEVLFECPKNKVRDAIDIIKNTMESDEYNVPLTLTLSIGKNWGQVVKL